MLAFVEQRGRNVKITSVPTEVSVQWADTPIKSLESM